MQIRDADIEDVREIQRVARTTWDHSYRDTIPEEVRAEFVRRAYSDEALTRRIGNDVFLVAVCDGEVLSFADFRLAAEGPTELAAIYVLPEAQEKGIGSRLLRTGIARFFPVTAFVLWVERDNPKARRFYEAHGFRATGESKEHYLGHEFHDVEMVRGPGIQAPAPPFSNPVRNSWQQSGNSSQKGRLNGLIACTPMIPSTLYVRGT